MSYKTIGGPKPADPLDMTGECTQSEFVKYYLSQGYEQMTIRELMKRARNRIFPREKGPTPHEQNRYTYTDGPMYYLGQQIVKSMQDAGYPAKISECYRSPDRQNRLMSEGFSKATAWKSPHQFYEAVDIIHPTKGWNVTPDYWETLASCVRKIAEKYKVELTHGHYWTFVDSAHIQLTDWKTFKSKVLHRWEQEQHQWQKHMRENPMYNKSMPLKTSPTRKELRERFEQVLPQVWKGLSPTIKQKVMSKN